MPSKHLPTTTVREFGPNVSLWLLRERGRVVSEEIVLPFASLLGSPGGREEAGAAAQDSSATEKTPTRHKNQQPGSVDRHLGFNWKQKQNNRAIHKCETKEIKLWTNMATQ